ncbi:SusC/RagA family TonB-linked outer membrane protein [Chitinophaga rhizophila]|uniref:SusC/RagA family TonB-linked outer membrane protein n=1 Tax=Chitinophaga rhizophila TaxID=2866212 RepID=A0ABS7GGX5_9BACT|nr:SusC/RagA family TonB-linked outer membrane protein [Chitinophaga rhizophila]MBW8685738.1 SusC/RagA family TonB-linked outer membrane protein [Chitinophaga rhizophila]
MRSHVLNWLWLCFAFFCSVRPVKAGTRVNHPFLETSAELTRHQPTITAAVNFQQKDTTVKPTASPVVITPSTAPKDTSGKKTGDTTKPAAASPVVITPNNAAKDSSGKQAKDTSAPATASPVVITPNADTSKPKTDSSTATRTDSTRATTARDTTAKPASDTALILPADSNTLKQEMGQFSLKGTVKESGGTPVPGAQVVNLSTKQGVAAGPDGTFTLKASLQDTIKISAPTFAEQSIPLDSKEPLAVSLTPASAGKKELKEVVVTALGIQKNTRAVGYAVEEVNGNAVQEAKEVNFVNALTGKVPGLQVNTNTGSMGGSTKITIRGVKSILGDNNAFVVVDGTPFINNNTNQAGQLNGGGGYDFGSSLQDINPEDIDNISILKGAASTALYGSRGANGVMLITTKKRPETSGGIGVTYSINAQLDQVYVLPNYQNQYGGGTGGQFDRLYYNEHPEAFLNEAAATYDDNDGKGRYDLLVRYYDDASWGPKLDGRQVRHYWSWDKEKGNPDFGKTAPWTANPNNVRDFYRTGLTLTNNIAMSGNNDKGYFRLSYGNMSQKFVLPNADLNRNNLSFNGGYEVAPGLKGVASINYSATSANARPGTGFTGPNPALQFTMYGQRQLDMERQKQYQYADGSQITWNRKSWNDPAVASSNGPYWNRYMDYETDSRNRLFGNAGLDWDVSKWLSISGRVFMDDYNTLEEERSAKDYLIGGYIKRVRTSREMNYQLTANINKDFGKDFKLNAVVGGNIMHRKWTTTGGSTVGGLILPGVYNLSNSLQTAQPIDEYFEKQINSGFATATLGYKNFLFLELTGRADWSSALFSESNPYFYPSASGSFVFSDLIKDWKWLSFGKLRASAAQVGSDTDPYRIYDTYQFIPPFGNFPSTALAPVKYNKTLKPERTTEYEAGVSLKFLDDRIGVDFTYYDRTSRDQIISLPISTASGFTSAVVNGGSVQNRGVEIGLNLNPIRLKNGFRWDINANLARNRNKLLNLDIPQYNTSLPVLLIGTDRRTTKVSVAANVGSALGTILGTDYVYDAQGRKIVGADGLYKITDNPVPIGNAYPDFVGGVTNSFTFKGIYLSALVDFQSGGDFFSYTNMYGKGSGLLDVTADNGVRENGIIAEGVTEDGKPNEVVLDAATHFQNNEGRNLSRANLYDASYIYLREVKLGYNLPEAWFKKVRAQSARLSLYGRNLWLIKSNAPNVDPSNIINSSSNIQGIEGGALPSLRSFGVNLNISF